MVEERRREERMMVQGRRTGDDGAGKEERG